MTHDRITRRLAVFGAGATCLSFRARAADDRQGGIKIGIIGAGHVGGTLGRLWVQSGNQVMLSARSLGEAQATASAIGAQAGTPAQAAAFGDVVVLAVPYGAIPDIGRVLSPSLKGKTVLDATNPYAFRDGGIAGVAATDGAGVVTQRYFPGAHVVRAFNSIDMASLPGQAHRSGALLGVPVAGDDAASVAKVQRLVRDAGFEPVVLGGLKAARVFQPGHPGFEMEEDAASLRRDLANAE